MGVRTRHLDRIASHLQVAHGFYYGDDRAPRVGVFDLGEGT